MTSYNYENYIEKAVRSVWKQAFSNMELIVVDDGSTDGSRAILAKLKKNSPIKMVVIEQINAGPSKALKCALDKASGEIIGFLSSDDEMLPERLTQEVPYFIQNPSLNVLYSTGQFLRGTNTFGNVHKEIERFLKKGIGPTRDLVLRTAPGFYNQAMLIRREYLLHVGGLEDDTGSDDWSLNIRIFQAMKSDCEFVYLDRNAFLYRLHENQVHRISGFMQPMKHNVVRKYFTVENRSKYACQNFIKQAFKLCLKRKFGPAFRYVSKARYISFSKGVPMICLLQFSFAFPAFAFREIVRQYKVKS
jgi:glycosyltransferase involved in cell wall biosynthesis